MSSPRAGSRSPFARRAVWLPAGLLVAAGVAWLALALRDASAASAARARLLADVETAVGKEALDADELQTLMAQLKKLPDHDSARDALTAKARILFARGQAEAADALFAAVATSPSASAAERSLYARILLRVHEGGAGDAQVAAGQLAQVLQLADAAYRETHAPIDLLTAWLAAERAGQHEQSAEFAKALEASHGETPAGTFVKFALGFGAGASVAALEAATKGLSPLPAEAMAMRAFALLQARQLPAAVPAAEAALVRGPGVTSVRFLVAIVLHGAVEGAAAGSDARANFVRRRDEQLAWVEKQPGTDAGMLQQCAAMRAVK